MPGGIEFGGERVWVDADATPHRRWFHALFQEPGWNGQQ